MSTIAVLGANGRLSRTAAKAFLEAGHHVIAVTRSGKPLAELSGARFVAADAMKEEELIRATAGADIIFNGLNPLYTEWEEKVMPMARNVMAAARAQGAMHVFPGNVYGFGSPMPQALTEETPMRPTTEKGRIRVAMEQMFRDEADKPGGVSTLILRAGDYFGGTGTGSFFDLVSVSKLGKGVFTACGPETITHEWAYLPDYAQALVRLIAARDRLRPFENLHFPGHAFTELELKAAVETAVGHSLKLAHLPWTMIRILGVFKPMMRELARMSYLRFEPHRLLSTRLESLIGPVPHTPLHDAVRLAMADLGLPAGTKRLAA